MAGSSSTDRSARCWTSPRFRTRKSCSPTRRPSRRPSPEVARARGGRLAGLRRAALPFYALIFLTEVVWMAIVPVAPIYAEKLSLSKVETGTVLAAAGTATLLISLPIGLLGARAGPRWGLLVAARHAGRVRRRARHDLDRRSRLERRGELTRSGRARHSRHGGRLRDHERPGVRGPARRVVRRPCSLPRAGRRGRSRDRRPPPGRRTRHAVPPPAAPRDAARCSPRPRRPRSGRGDRA